MSLIYDNPLSNVIPLIGDVLIMGNLRVNRDVFVKDGDLTVSIVDYVKNHVGVSFTVEKFDETYTTQAALIQKVTDHLNSGEATEKELKSIYFIQRDGLPEQSNDVFDEYVYQKTDDEELGHMERIGSTKASEIFMEDVPVNATFGHDLTVKGSTCLKGPVLVEDILTALDDVRIDGQLNVSRIHVVESSTSIFEGPVTIENTTYIEGPIEVGVNGEGRILVGSTFIEGPGITTPSVHTDSLVVYGNNGLEIFSAYNTVISIGPNVPISIWDAESNGFPVIYDSRANTFLTVIVNYPGKDNEEDYPGLTSTYPNNDNRSIFAQQVNNFTDNMEIVDSDAIMYDVDEVYGEPIIRNARYVTQFKNANIYDLGEISSNYIVPPLAAYSNRVTQCELWFIRKSGGSLTWTTNYSEAIWLNGNVPDFIENVRYRLVIRNEGQDKTIINEAYNY